MISYNCYLAPFLPIKFVCALFSLHSRATFTETTRREITFTMPWRQGCTADDDDDDDDDNDAMTYLSFLIIILNMYWNNLYDNWRFSLEA
jgi:hypothetical protein